MLRKIKKKLSGSSFFASVLKVGSGNLIGQAVGVITTPILSRIYSRTAYGDQAIIISTSTIIATIAMIGLSSAVMQPKDRDEARKVYTTAFYTNIILCLIITGIGFLISGKIHYFDVTGSYYVGLILMFLYLVTNNTYLITRIFVNREGRYDKLFFNPIIGAGANIGIAIPLGLIGFGYQGFIITMIISNIIMISHMVYKCNPFYKNLSFREMRRIYIDYKEYVLFQYPSNIISNFSNEYPTQFLGRVFDAVTLGGYSMCLKIFHYPIRLIASPISTVYFKTATEYYREGKNLAEFTYKLISRILILSFVPVVVCCAFSEPIFSFVLGRQWESAGTIASLLAVQYVMLFCTDCTSYCRVSIGRQKSNLMFSCIRFVVTIFTTSIGYAIFHSLLGTIAFFAIGNSLIYVFDMSLNFYFLDKKYMKKYLRLSLSYVIIMVIGMILKMKFFI